MPNVAWPFGAFGKPKPPRPQPQNLLPLGPPDPTDPDGNLVHWTLPPEQVIPPAFGPDEDPLFFRANFGALAIPGNYKWDGDGQDGLPSGGFTFIDGPYQGLHVPFVGGANSTPANVFMCGMTPQYPAEVQTVLITEYIKQGNRHFLTSADPYSWQMRENNFPCTTDTLLNFYGLLRDWGLRVVGWRGDPREDSISLDDLVASGLMDFFINGKEVDSIMTGDEYEVSLETAVRRCKGIPVGAHFTAGDDTPTGRRGCYPIGDRRDTYVNDWSKYNGLVHLMAQFYPYDTMGHMGAMAYYARRHVNLGANGGGDAARGPGAPDSRVIAFEQGQTAVLYGICGNVVVNGQTLRSYREWLPLYNNDLAQAMAAYERARAWSLLCETRNDPRVKPISGYGDGGGKPNGDPI